MLKDSAVADAGAVAFVIDVIQNETSAGEAAGLDGADGEDRVVEGTKAVVDDNDDLQAKTGREIGECFCVC